MIAVLLAACHTPPPPVIGLQEPAPRVQPEGCPTPGEPVVRGTVASEKLDEISGIVKSRRHDVFWVHNDSGGKARLHAVGQDGSDRGRVSLKGAAAVDWEDMAWLPGESGDWLVLGDIGDNREMRQSVQLYRVAEPIPGAPGKASSERMVVRYPNGARNAEALFGDPRDGELYILTKSDDGHSVLYALGPWKVGDVLAREVGSYDFPAGYSTAKATAADMHADGSWLAIRTYTTGYLFPVEGTVADALKAEPCVVPWPEEPQGESIAFVEGGLVSISEKEGAKVYFVPWNPAAAEPDE